MKALLCESFGPPENLRLADVDPPTPDAGEVRVRVRACGVNFADTLIIQGLYQEKPPLPFAAGLEAAGEIDAVGDGVDGVAVGQRVIALPGRGGMAEQLVCKASAVMPIPDALDFPTAAGFAVAYGTAHVALRYRANIQAGETLLVHGAAGGVGLAAVDVGKAMGATVIATASTAPKRALAAAKGADETIDYTDGGFRDAVKALTDGRGADVIFDPVGGKVFDESLRCIAWNGRVLVIGFASGTIPKLPANLALVKNMGVLGVYWGAYARNEPHTLAESMQWLLEQLGNGALTPDAVTTYPLADGARALSDLAERRSQGKLVVLP